MIEALERVVALMNEEESVKCSIRGVESVQKKDFAPGIISIPAAAEASAPEANPLDMASMHSSFEILKAPSSSQVVALSPPPPPLTHTRTRRQTLYFLE